jgi:hypothetical protein
MHHYNLYSSCFFNTTLSAALAIITSKVPGSVTSFICLFQIARSLLLIVKLGFDFTRGQCSSVNHLCRMF